MSTTNVTLSQFQGDLAKLQSDVASDVASLKAQIATLQQQVAAGQLVTQDQLNALDATVTSIDTTVNPPPPQVAGS